MKTISKIHYITNGRSKDEILSEVDSVLEAGIDWIQLRMKDENLNQQAIAEEVKEKCHRKAVFIINDRVELAKEIDADGVHLGKEDIPIDEAREILGDEKIIGGSANTIADCKNLELSGVDYIGMGPFAFTETKKQLAAIIGLGGFQKLFPKEEEYGWMISSINCPVLAIGGITNNDIEEIMNTTSLHGVAVSGMIAKASNKEAVVNELKEKVYG
ncbi:thiamine phosphate synthase [Crocinitomix catalasitica]|nr:thiamine phosphate synthase [Crocinitomix catalasitica]